MTREEEVFVQKILEERDELFRETSRLKSQLSGYEDFESERTSLHQQLSQKDHTIMQLKQTIERLQRKVWGKSSEKYISEDPEQRKLDFEGLDLLPEEKELAENAKGEIESFKTVRIVEKERNQPVRKPLSESLPREEYHIYPENIDLEKYTELEPEVTEILEREPARWYVRRIIRHKYVLRNKNTDDAKQVVTAPMPVLPIAKSYAGATVLADINIDKYVYHLPFYRQIKMFSQQGIPIAPATLNGWFQNTADLMRPAYYRLKELALSSDYIQSDETTIPVINDEKHQAVKGYIWMVRTVVQDLVFFHYDYGSRAQKVALHLFKDYQGFMRSLVRSIIFYKIQ
jgi:transposase